MVNHSFHIELNLCKYYHTVNSYGVTCDNIYTSLISLVIILSL